MQYTDWYQTYYPIELAEIKLRGLEEEAGIV